MRDDIQIKSSTRRDDGSQSKTRRPNVLFSLVVLMSFSSWKLLDIGSYLHKSTDKATSMVKISKIVADDPREYEETLLDLFGPSDKRLPILEAKYDLVWLHVPDNVTRGTSYEGVQCSFCPVNWEQQKRAPNTAPRYANAYSWEECNKNELAEVQFDFSDLVRMVRRYDQLNTTIVNHLKQTGFIFHESRSGSTLAANMLVVADPSAHRVYSEPNVLLKAMKSNNTDLVRDVLYMLGRSSNSKERHVFYKLKSEAVRSIDAMPADIPWIFMYRDPQEVMASHFNPTEHNSTVCLFERKHPHPLMAEIASADLGKDIRYTTDAQFCAIRLASLCLAAIRQHNRTGKGRFVNYNTLPESMWETIAPDHFGIRLPRKHIARMKNISGVYAKGARDGAKVEWQEESHNIQNKTITNSQRKAALKILEPYVEQMEEFK